MPILVIFSVRYRGANFRSGGADGAISDLGVTLGCFAYHGDHRSTSVGAMVLHIIYRFCHVTTIMIRQQLCS